MQTFTLRRLGETKVSTWANLYGPKGEYLCEILERGAAPFLHPRIPAGTYRLALRTLGTSKFDAALKDYPVPGYRGIIQIQDVPGRSAIEIHPANHYWELEGCLAPGTDVAGEPKQHAFCIPGGASRPAFAHIYPLIANAIDLEGAQLTITDKDQ